MMTQTTTREKTKMSPRSEQPRSGSNPPLPRPYSSETVAGLAAAAALASSDSAAFASRLFFKISHLVKTSPSPGMR